MAINIARLGLSEKDIEDWLYENPEEIYGTFGKPPISRWFGRQYALPSGIADLIGIRDDTGLVVIEVKNVAINKAAILQVSRYADDLEEIAGYRLGYPNTDNFQRPYVERVVVGPSIDPQTMIEAESVGVRVWLFQIEINVSVSRIYPGKEEARALERKRESIAYRPEWHIFGQHVTDAVEQDAARQEEEARIIAAIDKFSEKSTTPDEYDGLLEAIVSNPDEGDDAIP